MKTLHLQQLKPYVDSSRQAVYEANHRAIPSLLASFGRKLPGLVLCLTTIAVLLLCLHCTCMHVLSGMLDAVLQAGEGLLLTGSCDS